jgi:hypothetical protein
LPALLRWLQHVQAMLLSDSSEKLDPMSLLFYMSSFSVLLLLPMTVLLEPGSFAQVRYVQLLADAQVAAVPVPTLPMLPALHVGVCFWAAGNSCREMFLHCTCILRERRGQV